MGMISIRCGRSGEVFLENRCNICEKFQDGVSPERKTLPCRDQAGYRLPPCRDEVTAIRHRRVGQVWVGVDRWLEMGWAWTWTLVDSVCPSDGDEVSCW